MKNNVPVREMQPARNQQAQAEQEPNNGKTVKSKKKKLKKRTMKDNSGKILLALLAGASAGVVAGLLMAPETGEATRGNLRKSANRLGKDLEGMLKQTIDKIDNLNLNIPGVTGGTKTAFKGDWNTVKGKLKQRYAQLTDEDLTYADGAGDELYGNLQRALGMTRQEVEKMLGEL